MVLWPDGALLFQDGAIILFAGFNTVYFAWYGLKRAHTRARRVATVALALVNASLALEAAFFLAFFNCGPFGRYGGAAAAVGRVGRFTRPPIGSERLSHASHLAAGPS